MRKRMFNLREYLDYVALGRNKGMEWAKEIGAMTHIGRHTLFDKVAIDKALDELAGNKENEEAEKQITKRLFKVNEYLEYVGLGRTKGMEWANEIGAVGHIGRRAYLDRAIIDKALDELPRSGKDEE